MKTPPPTPAALGYRMPAEWEPHEATWLTWPRGAGASFPNKFEPVPAYWVKLAEELSPHERVHIVVHDEAHEENVRRLLSTSRKLRPDRVLLHRYGCNECWCRDHGPIFVTRDSEFVTRDAETASRESQTTNHKSPVARHESPLAVLDWLYNAWGGKYPPWDLDDAIPQRVAETLGLPLFSPDMVLEGGSIDVNGRGTLLTTESVLLNKNRNPQFTKAQIEQRLRDYLGVRHVLWLGDGIAGDDTDGHVDDITRFVDERTIVTCVEEDPADGNYAPLQENLKRLRAMRDQDGQPLRVVEVPMPGRLEGRGQRLPASYANFYIANNVVLVPVYSHRNDRRALEILQSCFPDRRVVGIECTDLVWGLGALHCVTQQQPRG